MNSVPTIPESAPFTAEQRAYLNGFFAGLFSRAPGNAQPMVTAAGEPLTILFGSQTGTAENLAKRVSREMSKRGFAPSVVDLGQYNRERLLAEKNLLIITSTYGDGDPPDNAKNFWDYLSSDRAPQLPATNFSVLSLGDSNYAKFCECGKNFDRRLESLGARRIHPRVDCDVEYEGPFGGWLSGVTAALSGKAALPQASTSLPEVQAMGYSKSSPFQARLITNRKLNGAGSAKDTRHFEISLEGSGLAYRPGDALGVMPTNCPKLVDDILKALQCEDSALRETLTRDYEVTRIPQPLLKAVAEKSGDQNLQRLAAPEANGELTKFLYGREIIDLLLAHPDVKFTPAEFLAALRKLQPRLYSISSSLKAHPGQVHLTVGIVRYESLGRARTGVCSCFLGERVTTDTPVPVYIHENKNFRLPDNPSIPIIMVGPGTGIAPFRAFLQERKAISASGKNWLFFGEQHAGTDFLYREELEASLRDGVLTRLDTAFSRDQAAKIYVQNNMLEHAAELFKWLEDGSYFYVCGDAKRMARDVDAALQQVVERGGNRSATEAADYVARLKSDKRYQRDVY